MVLQRYVQMATEGGVPQAVFPEGGLTTDGLLRAPKLGLLDYMFKTFDPTGERDLVIIPVGINYDRVLEDRSLFARRDPAAPRAGLGRSVRIIGAYLGRQLLLRARRKSFRNGYACVNFGQPLSMRERALDTGIDFRVLDESARHEAVALVGEKLMEKIGQIVPVLPVPLVATVLLRNPQNAVSELELKSALSELILGIEALGAHVYVPRADLDYALDVGLRMLTLRRMVTEEEGLYRANANELQALQYYANSIDHLCKELEVPVIKPGQH
jgi:glycerol-3-phosphate O-acyltransferase